MTKEELLACFRKEITARSEAEIALLHQEMEHTRIQSELEMMGAAEQRAQHRYEQEAEEIRSAHSIAMSRLKDKNHQRLMNERAALSEELFTEVKERLRAYRESDAYLADMKAKLSAYEAFGETAVLQLGKADANRLKNCLACLPQGTQGELCEDIQLGGYRLVLAEHGRIIDETYDSAFVQAKAYFLEHSGLILE